MLVGGFSPAGSSVAFGPALRSGQFDPFDLDPLRQVLAQEIEFGAVRRPGCPRVLAAAKRVRDGKLQIFRNRDITADVVLASTCPPLVHCAVEIEGCSYWDGGYAANPPVLGLAHESNATDLLVVQITPARDRYIPMTMAAIDRRLDQITANSTLNAEIAALELQRDAAATSLRVFRIAAEDEIDGLAQRSPVDLGRRFIGKTSRNDQTRDGSLSVVRRQLQRRANRAVRRRARAPHQDHRASGDCRSQCPRRTRRNEYSARFCFKSAACRGPAAGPERRDRDRRTGFDGIGP